MKASLQKGENWIGQIQFLVHFLQLACKRYTFIKSCLHEQKRNYITNQESTSCRRCWIQFNPVQLDNTFF